MGGKEAMICAVKGGEKKLSKKKSLAYHESPLLISYKLWDLYVSQSQHLRGGVSRMNTIARAVILYIPSVCRMSKEV